MGGILNGKEGLAERCFGRQETDQSVVFYSFFLLPFLRAIHNLFRHSQRIAASKKVSILLASIKNFAQIGLQALG